MIDNVLEGEMLAKDIWYLSSMFGNFQLLHVKREGNQVTHTLAKYVRKINSNVHCPKLVTELVAAHSLAFTKIYPGVVVLYST